MTATYVFMYRLQVSNLTLVETDVSNNMRFKLRVL